MRPFTDFQPVDGGSAIYQQLADEIQRRVSEGELKTGMTGYAKIATATMPVWKAFSLTLLRFLNIQVWSWIP